MDDVDALRTDSDLMLVAREPRHPALWIGVAVQLTALAVLTVVGAGWYGNVDAPWWTEFAGAPSALLALAGGFVAAWRPRRQDAAPVEGARWLRAFWQVVYVTAIGMLLTVVSLFTDGMSWPSVLLITAGLGTTFLSLATLALVVAPVVVLTDVCRPGVNARWYDAVSAGGIVPWILVQAGTLTWAVEVPVARNGYLSMWVGVVLGTVETREPWLVWLVRGTTAIFVMMAWRVTVVSRRAVAARRAA